MAKTVMLPPICAVNEPPRVKRSLHGGTQVPAT